MIVKEQLYDAGKILKTHGYKGDVTVASDFGKEIFKLPGTAFFVEFDNIPVPFFVEKVGGGSSNTVYIKFKTIDSDTDAAMLQNKRLYVERGVLAEFLGIGEDELDASGEELTGYEVIDASTGVKIGEVTGMEEGKEYDYLLVSRENDSEAIQIPLVEEFVVEIREGESEDEKGLILLELPDGFLQI